MRILPTRLAKAKRISFEIVLFLTCALFLAATPQRQFLTGEPYANACCSPEACATQGHHAALPDAWAHVYNPSRLKIHSGTATVTGTIVDATHGRRKDGARKEADGDCHGWLKLDVGQERYLNAGNMSSEDDNLVFEIVCMFPVKQPDALAACRGYKNSIVLPPVGSHVRMRGSWVQDDNHAHWNEIHPVTGIDIIQ